MTVNKTKVIIRREYLTRVRKKSFVLMTFLGPVLFALLFMAPIWIMSLEDNEVKKIAVIDSSGLFVNQLPETEYLTFEYLQGISVDDIRNNFDEMDYYALLYIGHIITYSPEAVQLMSFSQPSMNVSMHISNAIEKELERRKLAAYNIENIESILKSVRTNVYIHLIKWSRNGEEKTAHSGLSMIMGYAGGFLIYLFIFMFGVHVMRGVIEEKSNRIIEIIVSSVKPIQMMMGKIIGIALVGLTQFVAWLLLTLVFVFVLQKLSVPDVHEILQQQNTTTSVFDAGSTFQQHEPVVSEQYETAKNVFLALRDIDLVVMLSTFLFYFIGGYLLYASMFAAVGAMADSDTDTQQFMLPITIPLVVAILIMANTIQNPDSSISFWFSIIPFTSPVIMMARIPYGVPLWQVFLSASLLILTFIAITYLSSRIYRSAILLYGKKIRFRDILKM